MATTIAADEYIWSPEFNPVSLNVTFSNLSVIVLKQECTWNSLNSGLTTLLLLTFILNILSSVVLFRVPLVTGRGRSNPVYLCIRFLNVCDVLQAFILIFMPAFATPNCGWLGGQISCSIMGFMVLFFLLVSPLITILMAFDRVIALYKPFKYRSHLGLKMLKVLLPCACVLVLITTALPIFGIGEYHVVKGRRFCLLDTITEDSVDRSYVIGVHSVFLMALLFMLSCTITFQMKLVRMSFHKKHQESKSRKKISSRRTRNATMTTMAVCCIFIVCYLPYVIRVLVEASTLQKSPNWVTWITFGLAFLQPLLNPIVYVGTNSRYRQQLKAMLKNMSSIDMDTSSESGANNVTRSAFSGFRRRLSSGGSRNSKRGSNKRKNNGSHASANGVPFPSWQNGPQDTQRNGNVPNGDAQERNKLFPQHHSTKEGNYAKWKGPSSPRTPNSNDGIDLTYGREPSSSSGVKSFDSVEKMLLTPPYISSTSIMFGGSSARFYATDGHKYGRGLSTTTDFEPQTRERSNTVGEKSPASTGVKTSSLIESQSNCSSVPTLLEKRTLARIKKTEISGLEKDSFLKTCQFLDSDKSPRRLPGELLAHRRSASLENLSYPIISQMFDGDDEVFGENLSLSASEITTGKISTLKARILYKGKLTKTNLDYPNITDTLSNTTNELGLCNGFENEALLPKCNGEVTKNEPSEKVGGCHGRQLGLKRSDGRSSYKRALEVGAPFFIERKPSKRDSGVGEP